MRGFNTCPPQPRGPRDHQRKRPSQNIVNTVDCFDHLSLYAFSYRNDCPLHTPSTINSNENAPFLWLFFKLLFLDTPPRNCFRMSCIADDVTRAFLQSSITILLKLLHKFFMLKRRHLVSVSNTKNIIIPAQLLKTLLAQYGAEIHLGACANTTTHRPPQQG